MSALNDEVQGLKDEAREKLSGDLDELKNSFGKLRSDVMTLLNDALGVTKSRASSVKDTVSTQTGEAVDVAKERLQDWQAKGEESVEALGQKIGENPVTSALIALGVGFILAKLLTRK